MKLINLVGIFISLGLLLSIGGCAKKKPACGEENRFSGFFNEVIEYDKDELVANNKAMYKVIRICKSKGLRADILDYKSRYQGMGYEQKQLATIAAKDLSDTVSTTSKFDYQVMVRFRCLDSMPDAYQ